MGLFDSLQNNLSNEIRARQKESEAQDAARKVEETRKAFQNYGVQRQQDIARALSRRICTGDAGLPFLMIRYGVRDRRARRGEIRKE